MRSLGINAIQARYSERDLDRDENLQYQDWIERLAAVALLERLPMAENWRSLSSEQIAGPMKPPQG